MKICTFHPLPMSSRNFVRNNTNYFSTAGAWCYNDEGTDPRWEYCAIPACPATGLFDLNHDQNFKTTVVKW